MTPATTPGSPLPAPPSRPVWLLGFLVGSVAAQLVVVSIGLPFWRLGDDARRAHPSAELLASSGGFGQLLGLLGFGAMLLTWVWSVRKLLQRLPDSPPSRPFLAVHIAAGLLAPLFVLEHAGFRFGGLPGVAAAGLLAVTASGVVGRWVYRRLPARVEVVRGDATFGAELLLRSSVGMDPDTPGAPSAAVVEAVDALTSVPFASVNLLGLPAREAALRRARRQTDFALDDAPGPGRVRIAIAAELDSALRARREFHRLEAFRRLLRWWHIVHVALAHAVFVIAALHVGIALRYSGTWARLQMLVGG